MIFALFRRRMSSEDTARVCAFLAEIMATEDLIVDGDPILDADPSALSLAIQRGFLSVGSFWSPIYSLTKKGEQFMREAQGEPSAKQSVAEITNPAAFVDDRRELIDGEAR